MVANSRGVTLSRHININGLRRLFFREKNHHVGLTTSLHMWGPNPKCAFFPPAISERVTHVLLQLTNSVRAHTQKREERHTVCSHRPHLASDHVRLLNTWLCILLARVAAFVVVDMTIMLVALSPRVPHFQPLAVPFGVFCTSSCLTRSP